MSKRDRQRGFILLAALVLVALAGVIMAAAVRSSSAAVLRANSAQERLQRRWGEISLERAFGRRAEEMLSIAEIDSEGPVVACRRRFALGGMSFELIFSDEQAKANVNAIHARKGRLGLTRALQSLIGPADRGMAVSVKHVGADSASGGEQDEGLARQFRCFGQVFGRFDVAAFTAPGDERRARPLELITCWGDGKLNFRRCRPEVLREATAGILTAYQRDKLISMRKEIPGLSLAEALKRLELTRRRRKQAQAVLTDRSTCYSLWTIARTSNRQWYRLAIRCDAGMRDQDQQPGPLVRTFVW